MLLSDIVFGGFVMAVIQFEQELHWNTEEFWMMLLIVGCCHCYFAILKVVCAVRLRLQALIHNPVLNA
jgi:ABC-type branched-subunit amino acid transport system permease subunit